MRLARMMAACSGAVLLCAAAWAYQPRCNVVRAVYIHASDVVPAEVWQPYGAGGRYVSDRAHSGRFSLMCENAGGPGSGAGVVQVVELNQRQPRPVKIAGWSMAEGVEGKRGWQYSLYVDFVLADGKPWPMKIATFDTGTHGWQYSEAVVVPPKPIRSARFYAFLREFPGKVWFDDLFFGEVGGPNLLRCPGFEMEGRVDEGRRERIFRRWREMGANGMHVYLSPNRPYWPSKLVKTPFQPGQSPLEGFLAAARRAGIGVWTTPSPLWHRIRSADDPDFPEYYCPNGRWGDEWVAVLEDLARFDFAGISLVPDEYNYNNGRLKRRYAKHRDQRVRKFYQQMPGYCDCPACRRLFKQRYGIDLPDLHRMRPTEPYRLYINFRYETTLRWLKRCAEAVKRVNPRCLADSLICVTPVCSDFWWGPGVAWDLVGYGTKIDFLTTDPYILLHNYLGDSTHWYVTETALRLSGASPRRVCGVVLEPCRLRKEYRELEPIEVYGAALSAVFHGAREVFYFHWVHISGRSGVAENPVQTQRNVAAAFGLLKRIDSWLDGARSPGGVALLHSRASEDWWRFYCLGRRPEEAGPPLTHPRAEPRYASLAQVEVLMALLRCGLPVDLLYLDSAREAELRRYDVIVVPFPFAVPDGAARMLQRLAAGGRRVVVISEVGSLAEDGRVRPRPALLDLLGLQSKPRGAAAGRLDGLGGAGGAEEFTGYAEVEPKAGVEVLARIGGRPAVLRRRVGRGEVWFLAGEFGAGLPRDYSNWHRGRDRRVYPPVLQPGHLQVLLRAIFGGPQAPDDWPHLQPLPVPGAGDDLEAAWMVNRRGELLALFANWRAEAQAARARVPGRWAGGVVEAWGIGAGPEVRRFRAELSGRSLRVRLGPQELAVVRIRRR